MGKRKKEFKIGDNVIVISPYEVDNYWVGDVVSIDNNEACIKVGTQTLIVNIDDLEYYNKNDRKKDWVEFYRNKYPHPEHWDEELNET